MKQKESYPNDGSSTNKYVVLNKPIAKMFATAIERVNIRITAA